MLSEASSNITKQFGKYTIAGVVNTAIGYFLIFGSMALGLSAYISNLIGYVAGLISSFYISRFFIFSGSSRCGGQVGRFITTFCAAYVANFMILYAGLQLGVDKVAAQICAGIVYLFVTFMLSRLWVFKE